MVLPRTSRARRCSSRRTPPTSRVKSSPWTADAASRSLGLSGAARAAPLAPFLETRSVAFQCNADIARAADGTRFAQHDADPGHAEILEDQHGDMLRKSFHQVKLRRLDEGQHPLCHPLVIQGVVD